MTNLGADPVEVTIELLGALGASSGPVALTIDAGHSRERLYAGPFSTVAYPRVCRVTFRGSRRNVLASACVDDRSTPQVASCVAAVPAQ